MYRSRSVPVRVVLPRVGTCRTPSGCGYSEGQCPRWHEKRLEKALPVGTCGWLSDAVFSGCYACLRGKSLRVCRVSV